MSVQSAMSTSSSKLPFPSSMSLSFSSPQRFCLQRPDLLDAPDASGMGLQRAEPPMFELVGRSRSTEGGLRIRTAEPVPSLLLRRALDEDGSELLRFFAIGDSNDDII